ncbi:cellulose biosynthesis protein BcsD [Asaia sp. As-1742]|uniref:cellulose biosynthesis protein BcsD n=1 Tax=Asaia sp. As-1742 TaxID=2608325 RepID=UPI001420C016|nr:cellulose biosynthesis protein BcsD [Asaia sp. As-1742]NIE81379.1 hypothetical protein [Asaia sp. As-1742]
MISPDFSLFIHSLATELELQAGAEESDALLFSIGKRVAARLPLPHCHTTASFELECNAILALIGWGRIALEYDPQKNILHLYINDHPQVGALGKPSGTWFASFYAGALTAWFAQTGETVTLRHVTAASGNGLAFAVDARD